MSEDKQLKSLRSKLLDLKKPAFRELMRIAYYEMFQLVTHEDTVAINDNHEIVVAGEAFFEAPWSKGPDVATALRLAVSLAWSRDQAFVRKVLYNFAAERGEYYADFPLEDDRATEQT